MSKRIASRRCERAKRKFLRPQWAAPLLLALPESAHQGDAGRESTQSNGEWKQCKRRAQVPLAPRPVDLAQEEKRERRSRFFCSFIAPESPSVRPSVISPENESESQIESFLPFVYAARTRSSIGSRLMN